MPCPSPAHLHAIHGAGGMLSISQWSPRAGASPEDTHRTTQASGAQQCSAGGQWSISGQKFRVDSTSCFSAQRGREGCPGTPDTPQGGREHRIQRMAEGSITCPLSSGCGFTPNDHFPPVTKSHFVEEFPSLRISPRACTLPAVHESTFCGSKMRGIFLEAREG